MKRITLLIVFVLCAIFLLAQTPHVAKYVWQGKAAKDTTWIIAMPYNTSWNAYMKWSNNANGTTCTVTPLISGDNGATFVAYPGLSAKTLSTTTGNASWEDYKCTGEAIGFLFANSSTACKVTFLFTTK